jgi:hypothetical protein
VHRPKKYNNAINLNKNVYGSFVGQLIRASLFVSYNLLAAVFLSGYRYRRYAPEQGTGPDTVNCTIKLRLLAQPTVPVSTAISAGQIGVGACTIPIN